VVALSVIFVGGGCSVVLLFVVELVLVCGVCVL